MIRIPFMPSEQHQVALRRVITRAACAAGILDEQMAYYMTHLLEQIAIEVGSGHPVRIPGFGLFVPVLKEHRTKRQPVMRVYFYPARAFSNEVADRAPWSDAGRRAYDSYRRRHHPSWSRRSHQRTETAIESFRDRLRANSIGLDLKTL